MEEADKRRERDEKMLKLIKALANGASVLLFFVMLFTAFQMGGLDRLIALNGKETITFVCILTMFFGIIWGQQKEIPGAILIIITYTVMAINTGKIFPDAVVPMFLIVAVLLLYSGIQGIRLNGQK